MEYAIPREHAAEAVRGAREILARHPVSFPIELRFVAADDALLSPAYGRDSAYVAVHLFEGMAWEAPFREVEALMSGFGGRPHWGKCSFLTAEELGRATRSGTPSRPRAPSSTRTAASRTTGSRRTLGAVRGGRGRNAALAAVGRHRVDHAVRPRIRCRTSKRSHSSPALAWRNHTRSPTAAGRAAEHRRLDLAGALLAVEPQARPGSRAGSRSRPAAPEAG